MAAFQQWVRERRRADDEREYGIAKYLLLEEGVERIKGRGEEYSVVVHNIKYQLYSLGILPT